MFKEISPKQLKDNVFESVGKEYFLISAGNEKKYNMMTAGWGFMGVMWGTDAVGVVIRPQRYTMEFVDKSDTFALTFFGDNSAVHKVCGAKSGRDCDKTKEANLTPVFSDNTVYFSEARMVIICKKQYVQEMDETCFCDREQLKKWYAQKDYHKLVIGRIEKILIKE